jgi:hypothetical protein
VEELFARERVHLPLASARVAQVGEEINVGNKNCWLTQQDFSEITNNIFILFLVTGIKKHVGISPEHFGSDLAG